MNTDLQFTARSWCTFCSATKENVWCTFTETDVDTGMECSEEHEHCDTAPIVTDVGICQDCINKLQKLIPVENN